jgi:pyruvate kinase
MKQTKIVATIGPASFEVEKLEMLMNAGMNVCRLNFSHSEHSWHKECIENIKKASKNIGKNVALLGDLQGPRIRTFVEGEISVEEGDEILLVEKDAVVTDSVIGIDQPNIIDQLKEEQKVLIEDGKIILTILRKEDDAWVCLVETPGVVKNHKGMNFPGAQLKLPVLTPKDKKDIAFMLEEDVDYIALSFVGHGEDVQQLREVMQDIQPDRSWYPKIISKVERQDAIENLESVIQESDAIMVARGDLGIEMPMSKVTLLQKQIIKKCLFHIKPVIVATQMLESMMENPMPTRAEVSDVTNAVIDHADATMLSGESAGGKYPIEAVATMTEIIWNSEESVFDDIKDTIDMRVKTKYAHMVRGVYEFARSSNVRAIFATSSTGWTAQLLSHFRPEARIYVATENLVTFRQMNLLWGVKPFLFEREEDEEKLIHMLVDKAKEKAMVRSGDEVVTVTNTTVKLQRIK